MKKIIVFGKQIMLAAILFAGVGYYSSCSDDDLTDVAAVRPEGEKGTDPTADKTTLSPLPTITNAEKIEGTNQMTISGTNLDKVVKLTVEIVADGTKLNINGEEKTFKKGDIVDLLNTKDNASTSEKLIVLLAEGKLTAYYDIFDNSKIVTDRGYGLPVPTIAENGFVTDWANQEMTISGENLDQIVSIKVGDTKAEDLMEQAKFNENKTQLTLPLWDGKIVMGYDITNPNRTVELAGYKFPVPTILTVTKNGDNMTIEGSNLEYITVLKVDGNEVEFPKDEITKDTKKFDIEYATGKIEAFYLFNGKDNEQKVTNPGFKAVETELVDLTKDMFMKWTKADATGESSKADGCAFEIGKTVEQGKEVYGDGNVSWKNYADLSEYKSMEITYTKGDPRLLFNREENDGAYIEIKSSDLGKYAKIEENKDNKVLIIDIEKIVEDQKGHFCHLNVIKAWYAGDCDISKIQLEKVIPAKAFDLGLDLYGGSPYQAEWNSTRQTAIFNPNGTAYATCNWNFCFNWDNDNHPTPKDLSEYDEVAVKIFGISDFDGNMLANGSVKLAIQYNDPTTEKGIEVKEADYVVVKANSEIRLPLDPEKKNRVQSIVMFSNEQIKVGLTEDADFSKIPEGQIWEGSLKAWEWVGINFKQVKAGDEIIVKCGTKSHFKIFNAWSDAVIKEFNDGKAEYVWTLNTQDVIDFGNKGIMIQSMGGEDPVTVIIVDRK